MTTLTTNEIKVWDPLVRIFHWSLVLFFTIAYFTEDQWLGIHSSAGYTIALLVLFRLLWGFIATYREALFTNFVTHPKVAINYLLQEIKGDAKRYIGHNPAGAAMVLMLLASLFITALCGMSLFASEGHGVLANTFFAQLPAHIIKELHEFFANFTILLIVAHVLGVLLSSILHKENLVKAMFTGIKRK
jgi:cytochrome b